MPDLFAILYPDPDLADTAMEALDDLARTDKIELTDACAVVKDENSHVHLHQQNNLSIYGALEGLAIGTLLGWFVLLPYLGVPAALIGALVGKFSDYGIDDGKMKDLSKEMQANSSALFILMYSSEIDIVLKELAPFGGRIFHTSLDKYQEGELEEKLEQLRNLYQKEAEHPLDLHRESPSPVKREDVIVEESPQKKSAGNKYRVVWYYTQWPQGSEYEVLAQGLTREEAEKLKEKNDPHLKGETLSIEEEKENPSTEANP
jgi:uncharacterized membrane protein